jgi:hypothetical protein
MDTWPRCERAMGFIALVVGAMFLALAGFVIYEASYTITNGSIVLLATGCVAIAIGLLMFISAGRHSTR